MTTRHSRTRWQGGAILPAIIALGLLLTGCGDPDEVASGGGSESRAGDSAAAAPADTNSGTAAPQASDTTGAPASSVPVSASTTPAVERPEEAPRFITELTEPGAFTLAQGASITLQLPVGGEPPRVEGDAIELIEVASVAPAGSAQWEIRAVAPGDAEITVTVDGRPLRWVLVVEAG